MCRDSETDDEIVVRWQSELDPEGSTSPPAQCRRSTRESARRLVEREPQFLQRCPREGPHISLSLVPRQFRDNMIANGQYIAPTPENIIPCSDMAGEIVAVGQGVKPDQWKIGDRVCANFTQDHVNGDLTPAVQKTALGGSLDGVLTEYQTFPAYVSFVDFTHHAWHLTAVYVVACEGSRPPLV